MPQFLRVPWIRWQRFRITGEVKRQGDGRPCPGLRVAAFDQDHIQDDFLGETMTNADGHFEIRFTDAEFKDLVEAQPDIYLCVFEPGQREPLVDTSYAVRNNASNDEYFEIEIPAGAGSD
jgi:carotenoid cleavage dioxygenase